MTRGAIILTLSMFGLLAGAIWASTTGFGVPQPESQPPSIREGSTRLASGHSGTRYFVGGGIFRGK